MWALDQEDTDAAVAQRIPLLHDDEDGSFPHDQFQLLPHDFYSGKVGAVLDIPNIRGTLRIINQSLRGAHAWMDAT
jgi:UDP-galactopyranose mutase